jgi:hypothetical protein
MPKVRIGQAPGVLQKTPQSSVKLTRSPRKDLKSSPYNGGTPEHMWGGGWGAQTAVQHSSSDSSIRKQGVGKGDDEGREGGERGG